MARGLSGLAIFWFLMTSVVVSIDLTFVLTRSSSPSVPHPYADHPVLGQWVYYSTFDKRYASNDDAFVIVQSFCNLAEVALQLFAVLLHFSKKYGAANKVALICSVMTFYKTVMYGMMEHFEGGKYTNHNSPKDLLLMVVIPSSFWVIIPAYLAIQSLGKLGESPVSSAKKNK